MSESAPVGRPSDYSTDLAAQICGLIVEGRSLRSICQADDMPSCTTVFVWLQKHPEFTEQYVRAREAQADTLADELLDISDDARNDWMKRNHGDDDPGWVANGEHIQRSRLRVDTRKWIASKLKPKKYGDKLELASDPTSPLVVNIVKFGGNHTP